MGSAVSLNGSKTRFEERFEVSLNDSCKRQRLSSSISEENENLRLIPNLPDEISLQILARVPRFCYLGLRLVSRSWKGAIMSTELFNLRKELGKTEEWLYILTRIKYEQQLCYSLDPLSRKWQRLPPIPNVAHEDSYRKGLSGLGMLNMVGSSNKIAGVIRGWLGRRDAVDRVPFFGSAIESVDGCLYILGGFYGGSTLTCAWRYDPVQNRWTEVNPMSIGRGQCNTSVLNNKLYVVGGVMSEEHGGGIPLRSAEVFDPLTGVWSQIPSMHSFEAQELPAAFKPTAIGMTSYKGKLFVSQIFNHSPFDIDVRGEVYDPETNSWSEMPVGMSEDWPPMQEGLKVCAVVDDELYALDPHSRRPNNATIKVYDHQCDSWKVASSDVPIDDFSLRYKQCLLASFLGKLHVIIKDANNNFKVLQGNMQNHLHSFPSAPSSPLGNNSCEKIESESETDVWEVIAAMSAGSCELVGCQIIGI